MPSIKDFDKKKKKTHKKSSSAERTDSKRSHDNNSPEADNSFLNASDDNNNHNREATDDYIKSQQRRPSKIETGSEAPTDFASKEIHEPPRSKSEDQDPAESFQSFSEPESFELQFPGSFIVKEKAPKVFDLAERIAGDWINDGKFEALPVGHPLAQILAAKTLAKAKSLEKNVLSSSPVILAKMGLEYAKAKIKR